MMYPLITLNDHTEMVYSDRRADGTILVYVETPIHLGFRHASCILPSYEWQEIHGYTQEELAHFQELIVSLKHKIAS